MKQYIDGEYKGVIRMKKESLKSKIQRKLRRERDQRLLKALAK